MASGAHVVTFSVRCHLFERHNFKCPVRDKPGNKSVDEDIDWIFSLDIPLRYSRKACCLHPQDLHITVIDDFVGSPTTLSQSLVLPAFQDVSHCNLVQKQRPPHGSENGSATLHDGKPT